MDGVFETQPDRTDLPLVVMPVVIESMIGPFKQNFTMLENVARVRMYEDFTLDEDTIVERCKDADAVMVIGFHCADAILDRLDAKCYAFGGTGVASYINLEKTKERGIRVCNVLHYGDHAVAEHAMALLMELHQARRQRSICRSSKAIGTVPTVSNCSARSSASSDSAASGKTVAGIANAFGMKVSAWNSHVPAQVFENLNVTPVEDMNELISNSDVVSVHMPLLDSTRGIITAKNLDALRPGTLFVNTARAEVIEPGALLARLQRGDIPAALDVFDHEPLAADDPLCKIPGIVLTPHIAWRTDGAYIGHDQAGGPIHRRLLQGGGIQRRRLKTITGKQHMRAVGEVG